MANPLHYPCLENPMDRGAWRAAVHGVPKSWTRLSDPALTPGPQTQTLGLSPRCFLEAAGSAHWEAGGADSSRSAPSQRPSLDLG